MDHTARRDQTIDRARTFLTLIVLLHHAVIPYTHYGHTDPAYWLGFDAVVLATDSFFMAMFFFISGCFVLQSLERKSVASFLRDRALRLGLPFAFCALTLIPLAYFAPALRSNPDLRFADFWWNMITAGPWPSGPIWFLWVLLAFDLLALVIYRVAPRLLAPVHMSARTLWLLLVGIGAVAYLPLRLAVGPSHWIEAGPLSVQTSRIFLYAAYYFIGARLTSANLQTGRLYALASLTGLSYALLWVMIYVKRALLLSPDAQPWWYDVAYGLIFVAFSASILGAIFAFFRRTGAWRMKLLDSMRADAYVIFLVHYPVVLWIQDFLFDQDMPAIAKGSIAFVLSLLVSWMFALGVRTRR